jgi:predicted RNA-binding protein with TRAM domain
MGISLIIILGLQDECVKMEHNRYGMSTMRTPPVKEGNTYTVKIESTGREGDGIAKIDGFVIFIPGAKIGEEIDVRINKVTRRVGFAEIVEQGSAEEQKETEEITEAEDTTDAEG